MRVETLIAALKQRRQELVDGAVVPSADSIRRIQLLDQASGFDMAVELVLNSVRSERDKEDDR